MQVPFRAHTNQRGEESNKGVKIVGVYLNEKVQRHILSQVRNRKNVKISANRRELKFPKDWDISQSLGNQNEF
jgi:hypothetical protein